MSAYSCCVTCGMFNQAAVRCSAVLRRTARIGTRSTLITSQLPVKAWHTYLNDPTLADAILDRVVHSSHKIELKGTRSMRDGDAAAVM